MNHKLRTFAVFMPLLLLLALTACNGVTVTPSTFSESVPLATSAEPVDPCVECAQATLVMALTQSQSTADSQAAATAEIVRANAQSTLNAANATLVVVQTQDQNNANAAAAQLAGTAEIVRANAQATFNSAGSTQSAALTQDAIHQTETADIATASAIAIANQQNIDNIAANTQTAIANTIATQTQVAVVTLQWYDTQAHQRDRQRQGTITFLMILCVPFLVVLAAGFVLFGSWRWLKIKQDNQRILESPTVEKLPTPVVRVNRPLENTSAYLEGDLIDNRLEEKETDDHIHEWLDDVKDKLLNGDRKDEDDSANS